MREAKEFPRLVGERFGTEPGKLTMIPVVAAVNVTDFCSQRFANNGGIAVIAYGQSPGGECQIHFRTLFKDAGLKSGLVSTPYAYAKANRDLFLKSLKSLSILTEWGINTFELADLIFLYSPKEQTPVAAPV